MMKHRPSPVIIFLLLLALAGGGGYWYFSNNPAAWQQAMVDFGLASAAGANARLTASGFIEARELNLSAEIAGRIEALAVAEGDPVSAGQPVVRLDASLIDAQTEQVEAQIALAGAQLAQLKAGLPREQIAAAEAAVALAEVQREAAFQTWQDMMTLRDNPQQLDAQIDAAYSQLEVLKLQADQAALVREAAELRDGLAAQFWELAQQGIDFSVPLPGGRHISGHADFPEGEKQQAAVEWNLSTVSVWQAWVGWENATNAYDSTRSKLNTLLALKADPRQAELQVAQAEADYRAKAAAVDVAQANLERLQAGPSQSQISILEAQLEQARSRLVALQAQREKYTVSSPIDGVVVTQVAHEGEIAVPGATLLTVANLDRVTLTVFVPASDYGRLRQNQTVEVSVDSYPGQVFEGKISRISDEAEFTPKNVQTQEERVSLVYAVEITLPSEGGRLKPGMPADAVFVEILAAEGVQR